MISHAGDIVANHAQIAIRDWPRLRPSYLKDILERMSAGHPMSRLDQLLPWNWRPATMFFPIEAIRFQSASSVSLQKKKAGNFAGLSQVSRRTARSIDNLVSSIADDLATWLKDKDMQHVRGAPYHPQTQGKVERRHQTLKNRILLDKYYLPGDSNGRSASLSSTPITSATTRTSTTLHLPTFTSENLIQSSPTQTYQACHKRKP